MYRTYIHTVSWNLFSFLICTDIAVWVLNTQITKDPDGIQIKYNYDLIDDLCEPKQYCPKCIGCHKSAEEAQDQSLKHQNPKYEPTNHLLYVLVSTLYLCSYILR